MHYILLDPSIEYPETAIACSCQQSYACIIAGIMLLWSLSRTLLRQLELAEGLQVLVLSIILYVSLLI